MLQFHLLSLQLPLVPLSIFDSYLLESVIVASVVLKPFVEEVNDLVTCHVQELSGVGYDHDCTFAIADVVLQPHDCVQIQMVCWLVQQQNFGLHEESSGQGDSHSPTS